MKFAIALVFCSAIACTLAQTNSVLGGVLQTVLTAVQALKTNLAPSLASLAGLGVLVNQLLDAVIALLKSLITGVNGGGFLNVGTILNGIWGIVLNILNSLLGLAG